MTIEHFVRSPGAWLSRGEDAGIVISSRVRLARNVSGAVFPGWAGDDERAILCESLRDSLQGLEAIGSSVFLDMDATSRIDKAILQERHLMSPELAEKGKGSGLVVTHDEHVAVMINEEDHLRLQSIRPGMALETTWKTVSAIDSELESRVKYAFSPRFGYLTACPSNVGTGLRASVMIHLSGLRLLNEIEPVIKGLDKLGVAVRGLSGEGTEAHGNLFQISNQATLGASEETIISRLTEIVSEVVHHERNARARLMESRRVYVLDQIGRAFGILTRSRLLASGEAVDLLSGLRFGVELGIVRNLTVGKINEIMLLTQPGHLQKMAGKELTPEDRDVLRSDTVRRKLARVSLVDGGRDEGKKPLQAKKGGRRKGVHEDT